MSLLDSLSKEEIEELYARVRYIENMTEPERKNIVTAGNDRWTKLMIELGVLSFPKP